MRVIEGAPNELQVPLLHRVKQANLQRIDYAVALLLLLVISPHFLHTSPGQHFGARVFGLAVGAALPIAVPQTVTSLCIGIGIARYARNASFAHASIADGCATVGGGELSA